MPGKKDCVTILKNEGRKRIQKRLVLGNLKEIYQQFKAANPEEKVGFSKFTMLLVDASDILTTVDPYTETGRTYKLLIDDKASA